MGNPTKRPPVASLRLSFFYKRRYDEGALLLSAQVRKKQDLPLFRRSKPCCRSSVNSILVDLSHGHQSAVDLCFLRKLFTSFFSRFPDSQIAASPAFSRKMRNGFRTSLPAHSDRIVQDLHLIPYYPIASTGTEKLFLEYSSVPQNVKSLPLFLRFSD